MAHHTVAGTAGSMSCSAHQMRTSCTARRELAQIAWSKLSRAPWYHRVLGLAQHFVWVVVTQDLEQRAVSQTVVCRHTAGGAAHHSTCCSMAWLCSVRFRRNLFARNLPAGHGCSGGVFCHLLTRPMLLHLGNAKGFKRMVAACYSRAFILLWLSHAAAGPVCQSASRQRRRTSPLSRWPCRQAGSPPPPPTTPSAQSATVHR